MCTVLLVEDHPLNRQVLRDLLAAQFTVLLAESAEQAQVLLRQSHPDLILMDVCLPGMDGLTLTRCLKADPETADIPIVALSAPIWKNDVELALKAGCLDYISKPITEEPAAFLARVARFALPPSLGVGVMD